MIDMKKNTFICFTGLDGSGKTTQAKNLSKNLSSNKTKYEYVYARFNPIFFKLIINLSKMIFINGDNDYVERTNSKKNVLENHNFLSNIYYNFMLTEYYFQLLFKIKIPLLLGKNVICDRYIFDTIITDISVDLNMKNEEILLLINKYLKKLPKPDIIFLIDVNEHTAYKRKDDIESIEYLKDRKNGYLYFSSKYGNAIRIDGEREKEEIESEIFKITKKFLNEN